MRLIYLITFNISYSIVSVPSIMKPITYSHFSSDVHSKLPLSHAHSEKKSSAY